MADSDLELREGGRSFVLHACWLFFLLFLTQNNLPLPLVKDALRIDCKLRKKPSSQLQLVMSNTSVYPMYVTLTQPESHFPEKHHAPRQLTPTGTGSESQPQFNRLLVQQGGPPQQVNTSNYHYFLWVRVIFFSLLTNGFHLTNLNPRII